MFFSKQRYVGKTDQKEDAYASGEKQGQQFIFEGKITFHLLTSSLEKHVFYNYLINNILCLCIA